MTEKPGPTEDDVHRRLLSHAADLKGERYPGDLLEDVRPRLSTRPRRRALPVLVATAASLLVVVWLAVETAPPRPVPGPSPTVETRPSSSASAVPSGRTRLPARPRLPFVSLSSAPVPSVGRAFTLGAGALAQVRPPVRPSAPHALSKEEP